MGHRGFDQAGVTRDRKYGGVAVKKEVDGVADRGENKSGVLFLLPNGGFSHLNVS